MQDWGLDDPTGKSDEEFIKVIREIEGKVLGLKERIQNGSVFSEELFA
jgi:arsenate reductase (thioredoxin)